MLKLQGCHVGIRACLIHATFPSVTDDRWIPPLAYGILVVGACPRVRVHCGVIAFSFEDFFLRQAV